MWDDKKEERVPEVPNFLIIGTARAGTTSLYYYLDQHPEVYMGLRKEPRFFAFKGRKELVGPNGKRKPPEYSTSWDEYLKLFEGVTTETAIGEASTLYLYHPDAPARIKKYIPGARLIAVLRDPIERAISHYLYNSRRHAEPCDSFEKALAAEEERIENGWQEFSHYRAMGLYAEQIERYLEWFPHDQLQVFLYEDFKDEPRHVLREIFAYLNVDTSFVPDLSLTYNPSGFSRFPRISAFLKGSSQLKTLLKPMVPEMVRRRISEWEEWQNVKRAPKPEISAELSRELVAYYRDDVHRLQRLIGRDLSHWLQVGDS